jgi:hypothetical protein
MSDTVLKKNCQYVRDLFSISFVTERPYVIHSDLEFMIIAGERDALGYP